MENLGVKYYLSFEEKESLVKDILARGNVALVSEMIHGFSVTELRVK